MVKETPFYALEVYAKGELAQAPDALCVIGSALPKQYHCLYYKVFSSLDIHANDEKDAALVT